MICEAFARGAGGMIMDSRHGLNAGPAMFYGVVDDTLALWQRAVAEGRDWYYADNAYFDRGRQAQFRVTKNAFQISTIRPPNYKKLDTLGVVVRPWVSSGRHVVVCEQSREFMRLCGYGANWLDNTVAAIKKHTDRPLLIRRWHRDKAKLAATLRDDLKDALVTHMSSAANEALISGVPVFVTGTCAASPLALDDLSQIERPWRPDNREEWAAGLVANQWSVDEFNSGRCWRDLQL
jgi:hypothetical protein